MENSVMVPTSSFRVWIVGLAALAMGCGGAQQKLVAQTPPPATEQAVAAPAPVRFVTVYFEYDRSRLTVAAQAALNHNAELLLAHPDLKLQVDGHCDERGTDAYNMALGWKRAYAVRDYLKRMGVDESRIYTNSYGRSRPVVIGDSEAAWSKNRRAEESVRTS